MRAVIVLHHYLDLPLPEVADDARDPARDGEVAPAPRARSDARGARRRCATPARTSRRVVRHDDERRASSDRLSVWLHEDAEPPRAGPPRRGPRADGRDATAAMVVEPRKVAPNGTDVRASSDRARRGRAGRARGRPARRPRRRGDYVAIEPGPAVPAPFGLAANGGSVVDSRTAAISWLRGRRPANRSAVGRRSLADVADLELPGPASQLAYRRDPNSPDARSRRLSDQTVVTIRPTWRGPLQDRATSWSPDGRLISLLHTRRRATGSIGRRGRRKLIAGLPPEILGGNAMWRPTCARPMAR